MNKYSILINTCDKFEDCWMPFFKLFSIYWSSYKENIYLNTEHKEFSYNNLKIISLQTAERNQSKRKITWSESLIRALNKIPDDVILYMQDDYFLKGNVRHDLVEKYAMIMQEHKEIHCIHLTDQAVIPDSNPSLYEGLYPVINKQRYLVSCQAALWRKEVLLSYLRSYESAWDFEEFGSERGAILKHNFYVVDNKWIRIDHFEIIPYIFTGIIQGRWSEKVVPLFQRHDILIDYSIRGFTNDTPKRTLYKKITNKCNRISVIFRNLNELRKLNQYKIP